MIVIVGYVILFLLSIIGLAQINKELVSFSEFKNPFEERKELNVVSNALVALYESESVRTVLLSEEFYTPGLQKDIDRLDRRIRSYVDSLYTISSDVYLHASLDTVKTLLDEKKRNLSGMIALMDSIKNLPYNQVLTSQYLSKSDRAELDNLVRKKLIQSQDTSYYIKERRSLRDRVRAVFTGDEDSTKVVTVAGKLEDSLSVVEPRILTDTLVKYFSDRNDRSDKRKIAFLTQLSMRQNTMFLYDEMLTGQINTILRRIEDEEKKMVAALNNEKAAVLERSSKTVSHIAMASLFVLLLFMYLTYLLTDRNQKYREQLEKSNSLAQNLLNAKERLLLMISHDVKAPLSSIIGHIEFMYKEQLPAEDKERLDSMRNSSEQILDLSNRMMHFQKLEKGVAEIRILPFDPYVLMNDIYNSFIPAAKKKNLFIESKIVNMEQGQLFDSDPFIIKQILNNLINNAIKFTEKGGIYIHSSLDSRDGLLNISVKDTGVGISEDEKEKIFEEFGRGGSLEAQEVIEGFGLGLPIVIKLVELLKGKLDFNSKLGEGTEFLLQIPLEKSQEDIDELSETMQEVTKKCDEKLDARLLWIDDDEGLLNLYSKFFERKGAHVTKCNESHTVFELLKNNHFDLILTDIQMPKINGFELVAKIRQLGGNLSEVPIVALSARTDISEKDFKSAGFTAFIAKPFSLEHLYKITCELVKNSQELSFAASETGKTQAAGFDALIEFVKDDKEVSLDILTTFLEDNLEKTSALKKAAAESDWDTVQFISHKMVPLMTMIGAEEVLPIISEFERGVKNQEKLEKLIPLVEKINMQAENFIAQFRNS